ncbi:MAG: hypothetical protein JSU68_09195 [Phycisphaerales bacterium]|nr:MAG: hypothetical protein JSU68_09195 [Phycisphaerales bacterium]
MTRFTVAVAVAFVLTPPGEAEPIVIPIDTDASEVQVELCMQGVCDSDVSPAAGYVTIELDSVDAPAFMTLHDFDLLLTSDLYLYLSFGWFSDLTADLTDAELYYATPGLPAGPEPLVDDVYFFVDVGVLSVGQLTYSATGLACAAFLLAGYSCNDSLNLGDWGEQTADAFTGTLTVADGVVNFTNDLYIPILLDPDDPAFGTITITGTVQGSVYAPEPLHGDIDEDGDVDLGDFATFAVCYGALVSSPPPSCSTEEADRSDFDDDGLVNLVDFGTFAVNFGR